MNKFEGGFEAGSDYLLEQFEKPETISLNGEEVEVVDLVPQEQKSELATMYMPGFSATPEALKDPILETAKAGRRVISAYAPHGIAFEEKRSDLPEAEVRKLELLLALMEAKGLEKVNVVAHSEAAIYVTAAAVLYPEKFGNIVLINPAGLAGDIGFFDLIKRTLVDLASDPKINKGLTKSKFPSPPEVGRNSVLANLTASVKEVSAISKSDISGALGEIHKAGVGVSIIHSVDDKLFPMEKVQEMVKTDMIDGFYSVQGTHGNIYIYEPWGRAAEAALSALEKKTESLGKAEKAAA